jgi:hypothetical protein
VLQTFDTPMPFESDAVLVKHNSRGHRRTHRAALGLLLNRVKRMRITPGTRIEIICGGAVYRYPDILKLLESRQYRDWLSGPRGLPIVLRRQPGA